MTSTTSHARARLRDEVRAWHHAHALSRGGEGTETVDPDRGHWIGHHRGLAAALAAAVVVVLAFALVMLFI